LLGAYGLKTYIWNNRLKSLLLLAGFPFLLLLISFGFALVIAALEDPTVGDGIVNAFNLLPALVPVAVIGALVWFAIAWFANQRIIDAVTHARKVDRKGEPRLWNLLENLCISRGITVPQLRIIETDARNAFASGVRKSQYTITVTRGLMNALDDAELEAVLAHELTHIENRDVQLLVIAAVFVGIISLAGDLIIRGPRAILTASRGAGASGGSSSGGSGWSIGSRRSGGSKSGGGGLIILLLIAVAIFLIARLLALALRFAMSRKREFLADAGSVELTKNVDAMISALRKIEGRSEIAAPTEIREMFFDHPRAAGFSLFATHPPIQERVDSLVKFAGGRDPGPLPIAPPATGTEPAVPPHDSAAPWGEPAAGPWENPEAR
jgi:heat shock protein HtpX